MKFDKDGFLNDPAMWSEALAERIARDDGIGHLSAAHWAVIQDLREQYLEHGAIPSGGRVCRMHNLDSQCLTGLFQNMREAWRIAGLPNPGEEVISYM